ncbi:MAG: TSUP family transporter [Kiritimatiellia bacterium]
MESLSLSGWATGMLCAFLVGFTKTGVPGLGILAVALMAFIFPAGKSTGIFLVMLITGDLVAVAWYRHHARWPAIWRPMGWATLGIAVAFLWIRLGAVSDTVLRRVIGAIILVVVILGLAIRRGRLAEIVPRRAGFAAAVGILGGFTTMVANAAGPIWIVYLLALRFPKEAFLGTNAWIFLLLNLFKVPFSYGLGFITPEGLLFDAITVPAILLGAYAGIHAARRIAQETFEKLAAILAAFAAVKLLL